MFGVSVYIGVTKLNNIIHDLFDTPIRSKERCYSLPIPKWDYKYKR